MRARTALRRAGGTALGALTVLVLALGLTAGPASAAPSDAQVAAAQAAADAAAARHAELSGRLAAAQAAVAGAQAASAIALDEYQAEQAAHDAARAAADAAAAAAAQAAADLRAARDALVAFARRSFVSHSTYPGAAALLEAGSPTELIERAALLDAAGAHRGDEVDRFTAADEAAERADAAARAGLAAAAQLQQQAADALAVAQEAERAARQQAAAVQEEQTRIEGELAAAQAELATLVGAQQAAALLARQGPRPASTGGLPRDVTEAGAGSESAVRTAIAAGLAHLGTPYSWGGGGSRGPGHGIDPDAGVVGFDCSGLTQYAYAQAGIAIPRNSRAQYAALPKVARADLRAGDLVFWANDPGDPSTIYHVAIWLGDGTVLQAPQSGDVVKVSPMWWGGYAGAVRPSA
ncbi:C40 family peptidase [Geodermatophilus sp. SYSU D00815]